MSVIVEDENFNTLTYYVKGSPETLEKIAKRESMPVTFQADIKKYAKVKSFKICIIYH